MPSLSHANELDPTTRRELDQLVTSINAVIATEHTSRGEHQMAQTIPVGTVVDYAGVTVPNGWLALDGTKQSLTQYKELVRVMDSNVTVGTDTFTLPTVAGSFSLNKLIFAGV